MMNLEHVYILKNSRRHINLKILDDYGISLIYIYAAFGGPRPEGVRYRMKPLGNYCETITKIFLRRFAPLYKKTQLNLSPFAY